MFNFFSKSSLDKDIDTVIRSVEQLQKAIAEHNESANGYKDLIMYSYSLPKRNELKSSEDLENEKQHLQHAWAQLDDLKAKLDNRVFKVESTKVKVKSRQNKSEKFWEKRIARSAPVQFDNDYYKSVYGSQGNNNNNNEQDDDSDEHDERDNLKSKTKSESVQIDRSDNFLWRDAELARSIEKGETKVLLSKSHRGKPRSFTQSSTLSVRSQSPAQIMLTAYSMGDTETASRISQALFGSTDSSTRQSLSRSINNHNEIDSHEALHTTQIIDRSNSVSDCSPSSSGSQSPTLLDSGGQGDDVGLFLMD